MAGEVLKGLMLVTFVAVVFTLFAGVGSLGRDKGSGKFGNRLMKVRVGLCLMLVLEIVFYSFFMR